MGCFKSPPRKYFLGAILRFSFLGPIDENFYLIIPVLLLLRTMEIYYICSWENLNLKSIHFVITGPIRYFKLLFEKVCFS